MAIEEVEFKPKPQRLISVFHMEMNPSAAQVRIKAYRRSGEMQLYVGIKVGVGLTKFSIPDIEENYVLLETLGGNFSLSKPELQPSVVRNIVRRTKKN
jgi:hypothetical protein